MTAYPFRCGRLQAGATLFTMLIMLLLVLLLGMAATQISLQGEKAARNDRDRLIAFRAAEAALLDAELDIRHSPDISESRSYIFSADSKQGFRKPRVMPVAAGHKTSIWVYAVPLQMTVRRPGRLWILTMLLQIPPIP